MNEKHGKLAGKDDPRDDIPGSSAHGMVQKKTVARVLERDSDTMDPLILTRLCSEVAKLTIGS